MRKNPRSWFLGAVALGVAATIAAGCSGSSTTGTTGGASGSTPGQGSGAGGSGASASGAAGKGVGGGIPVGTGGTRPASGGSPAALGGTSSVTGGVGGENTFPPDATCINGTTQCTNCLDDDGDGRVDAFDPECSGPLDDREDSFATGIPGDNIDFCQDCFFDGNSGHGDDGCAYHTECLYGNDPGGAADCFNCSVSQQCVDMCRPFTPNGCDCFGCCEIFDGGGTRHTVLLSRPGKEDCTLENLGDAERCQPCVQSKDCFNDCGTCELCLGKTTLPPECNGAGGAGGGAGTGGYAGQPGQTCSGGAQACSEAVPCPSSDYCLTGCCVPVVR